MLEHPEGSHAWGTHGLPAPARWGRWTADVWGGWTCCVEQGHYGHEARKATWLYFVPGRDGGEPPPLVWGPIEKHRPALRPTKEGRRASRTGVCQRMSKRQRMLTPPAFADVLVNLARLVKQPPMPF